jgi:hypothetical protein
MYTVDDAICEDLTSVYIDGICEHLTSQKIHFRDFCNGSSLLNACQSRCVTHRWLPCHQHLRYFREAGSAVQADL